jgi:hypothetical protein
VMETCTNIIEALKRDSFEELYEVITNIMPAVTSDEDNEVFTDADSEVTLFVPPRQDVAGVLHAFNLGDLTAEEVLFSVLVILLVWSCQLVILPKHEIVPALFSCYLTDDFITLISLDASRSGSAERIANQ